MHKSLVPAFWGLLCLTFTPGLLPAQDTQRQQGSLQSTVEVERAYEGQIAPARRPAEDPAVPDSLQRFSTLVDYRIFDKPYQDVFSFTPLPAARPGVQAREAAPLLHVRGSLAYPLAPQVQATFQPRLSRGHSLSLRGTHRSFWGGVPMTDPRRGTDPGPGWVLPTRVAADASRTGLQAAWSHTGRAVHLRAQAGWELGYNSYYGHDPHELAARRGFLSFDPYIGSRFFLDSLSHRFHRAGFALGAASARPQAPGLNFRIEALGQYTLDRARFWMHKLDPREWALTLQGGLGYRLDNGLQAGLDWEIHGQNAPFQTALDRRLFAISPYIQWAWRRLDFTAGFKVMADNLPETLITPRLEARFALAPQRLWLYGKVTGNKSWDSYGRFLDRCPYLYPDARTDQTLTPWDLRAGLLFRPGETWGAELYTGFRRHSRYALLGNSLNAEEGRFMDLLYDALRDFQAGGNFYYRHGNFRTGGEAAWHRYTTEVQYKAWHLPAWEARVQAAYTFRDRFTLEAEAYGRGRSYAPVRYRENLPYASLVPQTLAAAALDPYLHLNLTAQYRITSRLSAFLEVTNLLNSKQQDFMLYRKPGTGVGLGASFTL